MKILHVYNHFHPCIGGIERYIQDLCKNLIKLGHQSDVVCLNTCAYSKKRLPCYEEYEGIKIYRIPYLNLKIYHIAPSVLKFVRNYDVIHVHGLGFFSDFMALTKFVHRKPLVLSGHGGIFHTKSYKFIKNIYFHFWSKLTTNAFKVLVHSKNDERIFSKITNCEYISYAVAIDDFLELNREIEENSFLYVGRISKNKRIENLIETIYFIKKKIPGIKLYVVGEDWEGIKSSLEASVEHRKLQENVIFTGKVSNEELLRYFSKAQFFVSASDYEAFGISVIEAMASGLTVIVNDIESFRNLVSSGKDGFIVDYTNPKKAAAAILQIMDDNLVQISRTAKKSAKRYDWEGIAKKIEKIYKEAM